jgi:hypothetical protein
MVTAFGKNPDGGGVLLRLWEESGVGGSCTIGLPAGHSFVSAQYCDLRGQPFGKPVAIADGKIQTTIGAYAPLSIILK